MLQAQEQYRRSAPTIDEKIQADSRRLNNWCRANPKLWESQEYSEKEPKIYISKEMLVSQAYRSLSRAALLIYQDFLAKREMKDFSRKTGRSGRKEKFWDIVNNGEIVYPYSEAEKNGFSRNT